MKCLSCILCLLLACGCLETLIRQFDSPPSDSLNSNVLVQREAFIPPDAILPKPCFATEHTIGVRASSRYLVGGGAVMQRHPRDLDPGGEGPEPSNMTHLLCAIAVNGKSDG